LSISWKQTRKKKNELVVNWVFKEAFKQAFALIRQNLKLYLVLNILYYGLIAAAMAYVFAYPQVQQELMAATMTEASKEIPIVFNAYVSGNFAVAVIGTFLVNLTLGTLVWITLPSLLFHLAVLRWVEFGRFCGVCFLRLRLQRWLKE
jgi:hypothetical protein